MNQPIKGRIYIANVVKNLDPTNGIPIDNDPHFWSDPPTWGICRHDIRARANKGDVIFYVAANNQFFKQMIFAYMTIEDIITHDEAFKLYPQKRMYSNIPHSEVRGNILTDGSGCYNLADEEAHRDRFAKFKKYYAIGDVKNSRMLTVAEIRKKQDQFINILNTIFGVNKHRPDLVIGQGGRKLNETQINQLLNWLNS